MEGVTLRLRERADLYELADLIKKSPRESEVDDRWQLAIDNVLLDLRRRADLLFEEKFQEIATLYDRSDSVMDFLRRSELDVHWQYLLPGARCVFRRALTARDPGRAWKRAEDYAAKLVNYHVDAIFQLVQSRRMKMLIKADSRRKIQVQHFLEVDRFGPKKESAIAHVARQHGLNQGSFRRQYFVWKRRNKG